MLSNEKNKDWNKRPDPWDDKKDFEIYDAERDVYIIANLLGAIKKAPAEAGDDNLYHDKL
ncbi:MAG: hypothetical protein IKG83_03200 [Prevotella sp.]|nr:hypothetical protein [Prevotella sp.]